MRGSGYTLGSMRIVYYPDPVLQKRAQPVDPAREGLRDLVEGMIHAMKDAAGVGLAGPQVGHSLRLFVASETGEIDDAMVFLNPEIRPFGSPHPFEEGCLSLPGINGLVTRSESVEVTWTDLDGERRTAEYTKLMARIIQHEFDHLEGVLFITRMTPADRIRIRADLESFEADYRERDRASCGSSAGSKWLPRPGSLSPSRPWGCSTASTAGTVSFCTSCASGRGRWAARRASSRSSGIRARSSKARKSRSLIL